MVGAVSEQATRKVLMSPELMAQWATRDERGNLLRWDWRQPDGEWWEPTITTVYADNLVAAVLRELREEVAGMMYWFGPYYPDGIDRPAVDIEMVDRAAALAAIDRRLGDD